ncbi:alpha-L-arabinofuranosidase C-terminal domain-containing protein [Microbacterium sp. RURRCA19A]|uniref:alpha-L-arabinofuranosidase C-terminal domain-containing protein n=1 Tax=Microbacterium sp. RURRCA19A TaxID=1907391 RepID=UPI00095600CA|nr:alpha-L-arabinofuranosidase C-terminal domain-containing protein [Microbacterium sp. RURRCA19A]SIS09057.1 Alpha-L-arabinofuranosidase [Microbacterium sp. RURRCA19A]
MSHETAFAPIDQEQRVVDVTVTTSPTAPAVSPTLFGLFLEDINFGVDGGLNANLVSNHSFEGVYLERGVAAEGMPAIAPAGRRIDPLLHWTVRGGEVSASSDRAAVDGGRFARVHADGRVRMVNNGYPGSRPGMGLRIGVALAFTAAIRADGFDGTVAVRVFSASGDLVATTDVEVSESGWATVRAVLTPAQTAIGYLEIVIDGVGDIDIDEVTLIPEDHWGAGDPRWSQGLLRRDLVEALRDLNPTFLRFPGGCLVEGCGGDTHYKWKHSVGPVSGRKSEFNMWGQMRTAGDYTQSMQVGFYEYFLLCEDLGVEPMPIVWAGLSCQFRTDEAVPADGAEFDALIQDVIDMIEWATGDPTTNEWAALRAAAGHPEPFALNMIGIGNENHGADYLERFDRIKAAVDAHRPGMLSVISSGANPDGPEFEQSWDHVGARADIAVDEHFYKSPEWFIESVDRYDSYPRGGARVFAGEYAAHEPALLIDASPSAAGPAAPGTEAVQIQTSAIPANSWETAVAEAAFLTGVERNAEVVAMTCYAPLFNLVGSSQWMHNLIDFTPLTVVPTPNYLVQQLFGTRLGSRIATVSADLPADLFVSASSDDLETHTKIVNVGAAPQRVRLRVAGVSSGMAELVVLSAAPESTNTVSADRASHRAAVEPRQELVQIVDGRAEVVVEPWSVVSVSTNL